MDYAFSLNFLSKLLFSCTICLDVTSTSSPDCEGKRPQNNDQTANSGTGGISLQFFGGIVGGKDS